MMASQTMRTTGDSQSGIVNTWPSTPAMQKVYRAVNLAWHFITFPGSPWQITANSVVDQCRQLKKINSAVLKYHIHFYLWVLMSLHVHLLIQQTKLLTAVTII